MSISWYSPLIEAMKTKSHLFWHSSAALRTPDLGEALRLSCPEAYKVEFLDCRVLPLLGNNDLDGAAISSLECDLLILADFDALLDISYGRVWMRQLRPAVMEAVSRGARLIVASDRPQSAFPAIDGSSLATDCTQYICPSLTAACLETEVSTDVAKQVVLQSGGLRGIAYELLNAQPAGRLSRARTSELVQNALEKTMIQCGAEAIAFLEREVLVGGATQFQLEPMNQRIVAILLGSGLAVTDVRTDSLLLFRDLEFDVVRSAIESAESRLTQTPKPWEEIAGALFTFERAGRRAVIDHFGDRSALVAALSSYSDKIRNNFKAEYGMTAPTLENMPNPVRWIDLSDLLDILMAASEGSRVAGFSHAQWLRAKNDILPLRNKIQHMRLPSYGDKEMINSYNFRLGFIAR